jgi:desmoglein 4
LYTNIPHDEGLEIFREALEKRDDKSLSTNLLVEMLSKVLKTNIFEFNGELFLQKIGTAIGTRAAPTYANIFMEKIDSLVQECGVNENLNHILFYKRFIDDILIFWKGSEEKFLEFMSQINTLHPTIKFTHEFDKKNKSTTYLDTTIQIKEGKIITDLYRKETDRIQYLLPNSCHPAHICKNVPYSLALRLVRICSEKVTLDKRLVELENMLLSRKYNKNVVKNALNKAREIKREDALEKVKKKKNDRVILAVQYHPKLPSISKIIVKHWRTMTRDIEAKDTFPKPPMVAYRQPPNLKSVLCRAKLPKGGNTKRKLVGLKRCYKPCEICPYILNSKEFYSTHTNEKFLLKGSFNCNTEGVIYLLTCTKCNAQYVGQTGRRVVDRIKEHLYCIRKKKEATGIHFSTGNHSNSDMRVQVIEKVMPNTVNMRLERESFWINKLATKSPQGLNKND